MQGKGTIHTSQNGCDNSKLKGAVTVSCHAAWRGKLEGDTGGKGLIHSLGEAEIQHLKVNFFWKVAGNSTLRWKRV